MVLFQFDTPEEYQFTLRMCHAHMCKNAYTNEDGTTQGALYFKDQARMHTHSMSKIIGEAGALLNRFDIPIEERKTYTKSYATFNTNTVAILREVMNMETIESLQDEAARRDVRNEENKCTIVRDSALWRILDMLELGGERVGNTDRNKILCNAYPVAEGFARRWLGRNNNVVIPNNMAKSVGTAIHSYIFSSDVGTNALNMLNESLTITAAMRQYIAPSMRVEMNELLHSYDANLLAFEYPVAWCNSPRQLVKVKRDGQKTFLAGKIDMVLSVRDNDGRLRVVLADLKSHSIDLPSPDAATKSYVQLAWYACLFQLQTNIAVHDLWIFRVDMRTGAIYIERAPFDIDMIRRTAPDEWAYTDHVDTIIAGAPNIVEDMNIFRHGDDDDDDEMRELAELLDAARIQTCEAYIDECVANGLIRENHLIPDNVTLNDMYTGRNVPVSALLSGTRNKCAFLRNVHNPPILDIQTLAACTEEQVAAMIALAEDDGTVGTPHRFERLVAQARALIRDAE